MVMTSGFVAMVLHLLDEKVQMQFAVSYYCGKSLLLILAVMRNSVSLFAVRMQAPPLEVSASVMLMCPGNFPCELLSSKDFYSININDIH